MTNIGESDQQAPSVRRIQADVLRKAVQAIFAAAGSDPHESERLAHYLVGSNLVGHDSHGVIRVMYYVDYVRAGKVVPNQHAKVVFSTDTMLVVDGCYGFGQVIAEEAMQHAIELCSRMGVAVLALRKCGHLGRVGDWPELAARAGMASLHFVNTNGFGILTAPIGGIERRLSANPIAVGIPRGDAEPIVLDISTCAIAEGKIRVARNKGVTVPPGCIINASGEPTIDPEEFYAEPPGAILPFGGHKGYGLGVVTEILAGALTGAGCSKPGEDRLLNGMLAILIDPERLPTDIPLVEEVDQFVQFVKSSRKATPDAKILVPGEVEANTRKERLQEGIPLDAQTLADLTRVAQSFGLASDLEASSD